MARTDHATARSPDADGGAAGRAPLVPFDSPEWQARLAEARTAREQVLAARRAAPPGPVAVVPAPNRRSEPVLPSQDVPAGPPATRERRAWWAVPVPAGLGLAVVLAAAAAAFLAGLAVPRASLPPAAAPPSSPTAAPFDPLADMRIVVVSGAASSLGADEVAARLGGEPAELRWTPFAVERTIVQHFHAADARAAEALASRLGGEALDLQGLRPSPPEGTVVVHLAAPAG